MGKRTTVTLTDEQTEAIETLRHASNSTPEISALKEAGIVRRLLDAGLDQLRDGGVTVDGVELRTFLDEVDRGEGVETDGGTDAQPTTGTESDERADAEAQDVDPDVWSFADGGEYATTWAVERVDKWTVRAEYHRHEVRLDEVDGPVETFGVERGKTTEQIARELAEADPEEAVQAARDYWSDEETPTRADTRGPSGMTVCVNCMNDISAEVEGPFCSDKCRIENKKPADYQGTAEGVYPHPEVDETGGDQ
jgi:hypothetical protein